MTNVKMTKCQNDKMSNDKMLKCQNIEMTKHQNDEKSK